MRRKIEREKDKKEVNLHEVRIKKRRHREGRKERKREGGTGRKIGRDRSCD